MTVVMVVSVMAVGAIGARPIGVAARSIRGPAERDTPSVRTLELYYTPPVLVRAGEPVRIPVHAVCATVSGKACRARVALQARESGGRWTRAEAPSGPQATFDLSAPAARAAARGGSVDFFVEARGPGESRSTLPAEGEARPTRFYVASHLPIVRVPAVRFGNVRPGRVVLELPWGSGPGRAGIRPGLESPIIGPSSFDVGSRGEILVADVLAGRVAEFSDGRLRRETRVPLGTQASVAAARGGSTYVFDSVRGRLRVRRLGAAGVTWTVALPRGIQGEVRVAGARAYAHLLPVDAWLPVGDPAPSPSSAQSIGQPLGAGQQLLSKATESFVRLAYTDGRRVWDGVELRGAERFGDLALAQPDGHGGFVAVIHVWRSAPGPSDQYQVVVVRGDRVVRTFAVSSRAFTNIPPFSRFRLGPDGGLYQMTTSPSGTRIVRYDLEVGE